MGTEGVGPVLAPLAQYDGAIHSVQSKHLTSNARGRIGSKESPHHSIGVLQHDLYSTSRNLSLGSYSLSIGSVYHVLFHQCPCSFTASLPADIFPYSYITQETPCDTLVSPPPVPLMLALHHVLSSYPLLTPATCTLLGVTSLLRMLLVLLLVSVRLALISCGNEE